VLVVFTLSDGAVVFKKELRETIDAHSMVILGDTLFIASTGTDSVLRYVVVHGPDDILFIERFWSPQFSLGVKDKNHVNSLFNYNDKLYVSVCGTMDGEDRTNARQGYIYNINDSVKVSTKPIVHPHSIIIDNGDLYYCEALNRSVKKNDEVLLTIDSGYARGLAISDEYIIVGRSVRRKVSKSRGVANAIINDGSEGSCAVLVHDRKTNKLNKIIDFSNIQNEIYEIIPAYV
jgi:hypothetical protein